MMEAHDSPSVVAHSSKRAPPSISANRDAPPSDLPHSNPRSTELSSQKIEAPAFPSSPKLSARRIAVANYAKQQVAQSRQQKKRLGEDDSATTFPSTIERNSDSPSADGSHATDKASGRVLGKGSFEDPTSPLTYNSGLGGEAAIQTGSRQRSIGDGH